MAFTDDEPPTVHAAPTFARIMYDLVTPLTVLKARTQLLQRGVRRGPLDNATLAAGLAIIEAQARRLEAALKHLDERERDRSG